MFFQLLNANYSHLITKKKKRNKFVWNTLPYSRSYKIGSFYTISNRLDVTGFKFSFISKWLAIFNYPKNTFHNFSSNNYYFFIKNFTGQFLQIRITYPKIVNICGKLSDQTTRRSSLSFWIAFWHNRSTWLSKLNSLSIFTLTCVICYR